MKNDNSVFRRPGPGHEIKVSMGTPQPNKFAEPGGATALPTGKGPNRFPSEFAGETGVGE